MKALSTFVVYFLYGFVFIAFTVVSWSSFVIIYYYTLAFYSV